MLCVLTADDRILAMDGRELARVHVKKPRPGNRWYVSFYWEAYRHWANWITVGRPFEAHRTKDYRYHGGSGRHNIARQLTRHKLRPDGGS